jgi:NAD(P)-dependent dehydrogenase (short-subunit alcohol dehydrogenase family)
MRNFVNRLWKKRSAKLGKLDILVNNAATQTEQKSIEDISTEQLKETFETNIYSMFWFTKYAMPHLKEGSSASSIPLRLRLTVAANRWSIILPPKEPLSPLPAA